MGKDSRTKLMELFDRLEASLSEASQIGANPMQLAMAMALPFARQFLNETPADVLESLVEQLLAAYATLRSDDAAGVVILRRVDVGDADSNIRYIEPIFDAVFTVEQFIAGAEGSFTIRLGEPLSVPSALGGP